MKHEKLRGVMAQKGFNVTKLAEQIEQKESLLTKKLQINRCEACCLYLPKEG